MAATEGLNPIPGFFQHLCRGCKHHALEIDGCRTNETNKQPAKILPTSNSFYDKLVGRISWWMKTVITKLVGHEAKKLDSQNAGTSMVLGSQESQGCFHRQPLRRAPKDQNRANGLFKHVLRPGGGRNQVRKSTVREEQLQTSNWHKYRITKIDHNIDNNDI